MRHVKLNKNIVAAFLNKLILTKYYNRLLFQKNMIFSWLKMMENARPEEEKLILKNDGRHLFRLEKELNYTAIKDISSLFIQKAKGIKDRLLRDILFEHKKEKN